CALIVEIGEFQHLARLEHSEQDVKAMSAALRRGGHQVQTLNPENSADFANGVIKWVNELKQRANPALLYYRGHLLLGADKTLRLAVASTDPAQKMTDGVSLLSLLKQLEKCRTAVLLLDVESHGADAKGLQQALQDTLKTVDSKAAVGVLIGCSKKVEPKGQSAISTCWSLRLRGDAEPTQNGVVTWRELVSSSKRDLSDRASVVIERMPQFSETTELATVRPRSLDEMLSDLADRIAGEFHDQGIEGTAIPDFQAQVSSPTGQTTVGQDFGPLLRYCGKKLRSEIAARANFRYRLLNDDWLRTQLHALELGPNKIQGPAMIQLGESLRNAVGDKPVALVLCNLRHSAGHRIDISCSPWNPINGATFATVTGSALLNPSEWAMIGQSSENVLAMAEFRSAAPKVAAIPKPNMKIPAPAKKPYPLLNYGNADDRAQIQSEIASLEEKARRPHPMKDASFPFRVSLKRNGTTLPETWSDHDRHLAVKVAKGDLYTVWIENQSSQPVFMRLLVDGLNTLPDHPLLTTEGNFEVVTKDLSKTTSPAQYVNLTNAKAWFCEQGKYEVRGFFTAIDDQHSGPERDAQRAAFLVTDAADSEAWRKGYPKDVGIVTAAFYKPTDRPMSMAAQPRLGTKLGEIGHEKVEVYQGRQVPGELLAVVHIRYGDF
ncbi:MAG: caspase family protein, partial [Planctomycetaceae bacterium]|nr:caspase family protein [Planctomycetaceae bacterium]